MYQLSTVVIFIVIFSIYSEAQTTISFNQPATYQVSADEDNFFQFPITSASDDEFIYIQIVQVEYLTNSMQTSAVGTGSVSSFSQISNISYSQNGEHNIAFFPQSNVMHLIRMRPSQNMNVTITVSIIPNDGEGFQFPFGRRIFLQVRNPIPFYGHFDIPSGQAALLTSSTSSTSVRNLIKKGQLPSSMDNDGTFTSSVYRIDSCRFHDYVGRWYIYASTTSIQETYSILVELAPSVSDVNVTPMMNGTTTSYQVTPSLPLYLSAPLLPVINDVGTMVLLTVTGTGVEKITFMTAADSSCPSLASNKFLFNGPYPFLFIMFPETESTRWTIAAISNETIYFNLTVQYGHPLHASLMLTPGIQYQGMLPGSYDFGGTFDMGGDSEAFDIVFNSYNLTTNVTWGRDRFPTTLNDFFMPSEQGDRSVTVNLCTTSELPNSLWSFNIHADVSEPTFYPFSLLVIPNALSPVVMLESPLNTTIERSANQSIIYGFQITDPIMLEFFVTDLGQGPNNMLVGVDHAGDENCIKSISSMTYPLSFDSNLGKYRTLTVLNRGIYLLAVDPRNVQRSYNVDIHAYNNGYNGYVIEQGVTYNVRLPNAMHVFFTFPVYGSNLTIDLTGSYGIARVRKDVLPTSSGGIASWTSYPSTSLKYSSCVNFVPGIWYLSFYSSSIQSVEFTPRVQSLPPPTQIETEEVSSQSITPNSSSVIAYEVNWNANLSSSDSFILATFSTTTPSPLLISVNKRCNNYDYFIPQVQQNVHKVTFYPQYRGIHYFFIDNPSSSNVQYNVQMTTVKSIEMDYDIKYSGYTSRTSIHYFIRITMPTRIVLEGSQLISLRAIQGESTITKQRRQSSIRIHCNSEEDQQGFWLITLTQSSIYEYNMTAIFDDTCTVHDNRNKKSVDGGAIAAYVVSAVFFTVFFAAVGYRMYRIQLAQNTNQTPTTTVEINTSPTDREAQEENNNTLELKNMFSSKQKRLLSFASASKSSTPSAQLPFNAGPSTHQESSPNYDFTTSNNNNVPSYTY